MKTHAHRLSSSIVDAVKGILKDESLSFLAGSPTVRALRDRLKASKLAQGPKRVDVCASQIAHWLWLLRERGFISPGFLHGASCLEIGTGWVMSHALVCHLLGASRVVCSDIESHANPGVLKNCISNSCVSLARDVLSPFEAHHFLRQRLEAVEKIRKWDFGRLRELGIEYLAPVDFAASDLSVPLQVSQGFDFIFSNSVLEHVPSSAVDRLLKNLAGFLKPGGVMMHCIHLEDHLDFSRPFDFLAEPKESFGPAEETARGNRIRASVWAKMAEQAVRCASSDEAEFEWAFVYEWTRPDRHLPMEIDQEVGHRGEDDLRVSHVGLAFKRSVKPCGQCPEASPTDH